ncbi:MAG: tetratricopeptide repeat protein [Sandaracinaceae bacterium]|nr:tetratricopeptide repeat protein [Sandaracinaceae bacterium]
MHAPNCGHIPKLNLIFCFFLALGMGCGGGGQGIQEAAPLTVSHENYAPLRRDLLERDPSDPDRLQLRDALLDFLRRRAEEVIEGGSYEERVQLLEEMTSLLSPQDFAGPPLFALRPLAERVADEAQRRGDEARALSALWILAWLGGSSEQGGSYREEYERVARWGEESRLSGSGDVRWRGRAALELKEIWEAHADLLPAPPVLDRYASVVRSIRALGFWPLPRNPMLWLLGPSPEGGLADRIRHHPSLEFEVDAALLLLSKGDRQRSLDMLRSRPATNNPIAQELFRTLESSPRSEEEPEGLWRLGQMLLRLDPKRAEGICRLGIQRMPSHRSLRLCLARASALIGRLGDAAAHYAKALGGPATLSIEVYDEALRTLNQMIHHSKIELPTLRQAVGDAVAIFEMRLSRFPDAAPTPYDESFFLRTLAKAELAEGHVERARHSLEQSLAAARRTPGGLLGGVWARIGLASIEFAESNHERARAFLEEALDVLPQGREFDPLRAELWMLIGESHRIARRRGEALRAYRQALEWLREAPPATDPDTQGDRLLLEGAIALKLGENERAHRAFVEAMTLAPSPERAKEMLELLGIADPNPDLAERIFWKVRVAAPLAREWKVRLALGVEGVQALANAPRSETQERLLAAESNRESWLGQLALLVRGGIGREALLEKARTAKERCEVFFYDGIRALRQGDAQGFWQAMEAVLQTRVLGSGEHRIARELLRKKREKE